MTNDRWSAVDAYFSETIVGRDGALQAALAANAVAGLLQIDVSAVRDGRIANDAASDPDVFGVRRMLELMARLPRLEATAIQTVGAKGWDGFALAIVE